MLELRMVLEVELLAAMRACSVDAIDEFFGAVEHAGGIGAFDDDCVAEALEHEGFFRAGPELGNVFAEGSEERIVLDREEDALVAAELRYGLAQMFCGEVLAWSGVRRHFNARRGECGERSGENDQREEKDAHGGHF